VPLGARDANGAVDQMADLGRVGGHVDVLVRDVLEQAFRSTSCW
jgi:hypothetical protein